jgi:hypothetical protein
MTAAKHRRAPTLSETVAFGLAAPTRSKPGDDDAEHALQQLREWLSHFADRRDKVHGARANHNAARLAEFCAALPGNVPDDDDAIGLAARDFLRASERAAWFAIPEVE